MKYSVMLVPVFAAVLLFTGCSSIKDLNVALGQQPTNTDDVTFCGLNILRNKTTKQEVINAIGAPGLVFKNELKGESWVYPRVAVRQDSANFQASGNISLIFPYKAHAMSHGGGLAGGGVNGQMLSDRASYKTAGLVIKFNKDNCVHSYEFRATSF